MHADDLLGTPGLRGEFGDRDGRGVRRQDDVCRQEVVELGEDLAFDLEFLGGRFDDEVAAGKRGAVDGALNAADRGVHLVLGELGFGDFAGEILADGVEAAIEEALLDFAEADIESAAREDVGDAVAHGAGAQHADGGDLAHCSPCT